MLDLHDNLLGGPTGRRVNGFGALALLALCGDRPDHLVARHIALDAAACSSTSAPTGSG